MTATPAPNSSSSSTRIGWAIDSLRLRRDDLAGFRAEIVDRNLEEGIGLFDVVIMHICAVRRHLKEQGR